MKVVVKELLKLSGGLCWIFCIGVFLSDLVMADDVLLDGYINNETTSVSDLQTLGLAESEFCPCKGKTVPVPGAGHTANEAFDSAVVSGIENLADPSLPSDYWIKACDPKATDRSRNPEIKETCVKSEGDYYYAIICFKFPCK